MEILLKCSMSAMHLKFRDPTPRQETEIKFLPTMIAGELFDESLRKLLLHSGDSWKCRERGIERAKRDDGVGGGSDRERTERQRGKRLRRR
jgi:hypothetical protein